MSEAHYEQLSLILNSEAQATTTSAVVLRVAAPKPKTPLDVVSVPHVKAPKAKSTAIKTMPDFLTVKQVADRYSSSVPTIWRWAKGCDFPKPVKICGSSTRWSRQALDQYDTSLLQAQAKGAAK